jgi:hypothetical protein
MTRKSVTGSKLRSKTPAFWALLTMQFGACHRFSPWLCRFATETNLVKLGCEDTIRTRRHEETPGTPDSNLTASANHKIASAASNLYSPLTLALALILAIVSGWGRGKTYDERDSPA